MRLPADTVIPDDKITKYLLVRRPRGDKSVWLESAGYSLEEPEQLAADLRAQLLSLDAQPAGTDSRVFEPQIALRQTGRCGDQLRLYYLN
jgi:hypothetical protein